MSGALEIAAESFRAAGFTPIDVPVLLPMGDFVRISGEEFRRRVFVTSSNAGHDWCLRPEFTIPVVRTVLAASPTGGRYFYSGRIFRNGRPGEADEVSQVGGEVIGADDPVATDAATLAHAVSIAAACGVAQLTTSGISPVVIASRGAAARAAGRSAGGCRTG